MDEKYELVSQFSDPQKVFEKALRLFDDYYIDFNVSTRKNKKYMIKADFTDNKWVHFGQMGYEDYTKHNDAVRRNNFRKRNASWERGSVGSPSYLSYHLLW
jgi:hypothetical protein